MSDAHNTPRARARRPARQPRGRAAAAPAATPRGSRSVRGVRAPAPAAARRRMVHRARDLQGAAQQRLKRFRKGSRLAVAIVGLLLLLGIGGGDDAALATQQAAADQPLSATPPPAPGTDAIPDPARSVEEATGTIRQLILDFYAVLPKIAIALVIIALAFLLARLIRILLTRSFRSWRRAEAVGAIAGIGIIILASATALSVIAGDATALLGSVGLVGLALSWALQAPIESFTGWVLNSFHIFYRVGDRVSVGPVFGDVYRIDLLSTTVWEAGGPDKPVQGAQPTGALATFPNSEILRSTIVNYTRHFPYVWDEVVFDIANESDLAYARTVMERVARSALSTALPERAGKYQEILRRRGLVQEIDPEPKVYFSSADSWTQATVRYLVPARERRRWASELLIAVSQELARPEHTPRIINAYPRQRVELVPPSYPTDRVHGGAQKEPPQPRGL